MGLALPFRSTIALVIRRRRVGTMCLVSNKASAVHLVRQVPRPLHVPWEQFSRLLRLLPCCPLDVWAVPLRLESEDRKRKEEITTQA